MLRRFLISRANMILLYRAGYCEKKVPWYTVVFSRIPRYIATILNFAEIIVKLPAVVAIWLICRHCSSLSLNSKNRIIRIPRYREVYHGMYHAKEIPRYTGVLIFLHTPIVIGLVFLLFFFFFPQIKAVIW